MLSTLTMCLCCGYVWRAPLGGKSALLGGKSICNPPSGDVHINLYILLGIELNAFHLDNVLACSCLCIFSRWISRGRISYGQGRVVCGTCARDCMVLYRHLWGANQPCPQCMSSAALRPWLLALALGVGRLAVGPASCQMCCVCLQHQPILLSFT